MADTIADILVSSDSWTDVYDATGITVGNSVHICNKGSASIYISERATSPDADSIEGVFLGSPHDSEYNAIVKGTPSGLWIKSKGIGGIVAVQDVEEA